MGFFFFASLKAKGVKNSKWKRCIKVISLMVFSVIGKALTHAFKLELEIYESEYKECKRSNSQIVQISIDGSFNSLHLNQYCINKRLVLFSYYAFIAV